MASAPEIAALAVAGAVVGSFLNVVAHRVPRGESVVAPRSRCPQCQVGIATRDNIPVFSWVLLRGRCRSCGASISVLYPLVELLTAASFAAVTVVRGFDDDLVLQLPFVAALIALAAIDLEHRLLPNAIVYPLAVYGLAATVLVAPHDLVENVIAGASAFSLLLVVVLAYPSGMGMGDVKLAGAMGIFLGVSVLPALLAAFLFGSLLGLALIVRDGAEARKHAVPFGVFLALGGIVGVLAGPELIDLYRDTFLS
jgi:leader peptidase (prepilin peptidase) / N-methyltransferase